MLVRIAALADYASLAVGDKLNIMGLFSNIMARGEPIVHAQMHLVVQFEFEPSEAGKKEVRIILEDADGREVLSLGGEIVVARALHGEPSTVNQIIALNNVTFPRFGRYEFRVLLNGRLEATIPVTVQRVQEQEPPRLVAERRTAVRPYRQQ